MRVPNQSRSSTLEVSMTPMIDVVFLLLVFFVWTSSFELPEFVLPGAIAQRPGGAAAAVTTPAPAEPFEELVIEIRLDHGTAALSLNGQSVASHQELGRRLTDLFALGVQPPVIIDPQAGVTIGQAVLVHDIARASGGDRVLFAADASDRP